MVDLNTFYKVVSIYQIQKCAVDMKAEHSKDPDLKTSAEGAPQTACSQEWRHKAGGAGGILSHLRLPYCCKGVGSQLKP